METGHWHAQRSVHPNWMKANVSSDVTFQALTFAVMFTEIVHFFRNCMKVHDLSDTDLAITSEFYHLSSD